MVGDDSGDAEVRANGVEMGFRNLYSSWDEQGRQVGCSHATVDCRSALAHHVLVFVLALAFLVSG